MNNKKLYFPIIGALISAVVFQVASTSNTFGVLWNSYFACVENPAASYHCYIGIDLGVIAVALISFIICMILIVIRIVKTK